MFALSCNVVREMDRTVFLRIDPFLPQSDGDRGGQAPCRTQERTLHDLMSLRWVFFSDC